MIAIVENKAAVDRRISLHGLGFIVVQLPANQRLHVWHPLVPKRRRLEETKVHNHRFSFQSRVLVGSIMNVHWKTPGDFDADVIFDEYSHEGARTKFGSRPWTPTGKKRVLAPLYATEYGPGDDYSFHAYDFHHTEVTSEDGMAATLLTKTWEHEQAATSLCHEGVEPDEAFDRFQMLEAQMWNLVTEVLGRERL